MNIIEMRQDLAAMNTELRAGLTSGELKADEIKSAQEKAKELRSRIEALELLEQQENGQEQRAEQPSSAFNIRDWALSGSKELRAAMTIGGTAVEEQTVNHQIAKLLEKKSVFRKLAKPVAIPTGMYTELLQAERSNIAEGTEGGTRSETDGFTYIERTTLLRSLYATPKATTELIKQNQFNVESFLTADIVATISEKEADDFFNHSTLGLEAITETTTHEADAVQTVTAASATAITYDELVALYFSVPAEYRDSATFVMNDTDLEILMQLKDADGKPLLGTAKDGFNKQLFGAAIEVDNHAQSLWFVNFPEAIRAITHTSGVEIQRDSITEPGFVKFPSETFSGFSVRNYNGLAKLVKAEA
jgi:HK97 family phage major capsid protein